MHSKGLRRIESDISGLRSDLPGTVVDTLRGPTRMRKGKTKALRPVTVGLVETAAEMHSTSRNRCE
jgi:hypothetical protein